MSPLWGLLLACDPEPPAVPVVAPVVTPVAGCPPHSPPAAPWQTATSADLAAGMVEAVVPAGAPVPPCATVVRVDLDGDGQEDLAQVERNIDEGAVRLRLVAAAGAEHIALSWPALPGGQVATWISAKPPGQSVLRDALAPTDAAALAAPGAVEVCTPPGGPAAIGTASPELRCYCSTWVWLEGDQVRTVTACD